MPSASAKAFGYAKMLEIWPMPLLFDTSQWLSPFVSNYDKYLFRYALIDAWPGALLAKNAKHHRNRHALGVAKPLRRRLSIATSLSLSYLFPRRSSHEPAKNRRATIWHRGSTYISSIELFLGASSGRYRPPKKREI